MDPWAFGRTISSNPLFSSIKLILLTDLSTRDLGHQSAQAGYLAYIIKPLHYRKLYDGIRNAMENTLAHEDLPMAHASDSLLNTSVSVNQLQGSQILLVEDNEINQRVAAKLLAKLHLQVDVVNNGQGALDALQQLKL